MAEPNQSPALSISSPIPPQRTHPMVTRSQDGTRRLNPKYALPVALRAKHEQDQEPKSFEQANWYHEWRRAMVDEYEALTKNQTWIVVPRDNHQNVVGCKWVHKIKRKVAPSNSRALIVPELPIPVLDGGNPNIATNGATQNERELLYNVEILLGRMKTLEDDIQKFDLKVKHHEANLEFLKSQSNSLDKSRKDLEGGLVTHQSSRKAETSNQNHENVESERDTFDQILKQDKKASSVLYREKNFQAAGCPMSKDILGIVAMLGKAPDDNLSRLFSEYLGSENMLAIVCKTYKGIKALESYDSEGKIDIMSGIHGVGTITRKPVRGRFLAICLEDLRPYVGKLVAGDPQKRLDLLKPRLPDGTHPHGFIDFAVNMVHVDPAYLTCVTSSGYGLRETLFYELFSQLQVYRTRKEMELAVPCISDGAISLDGGIIRIRGVISLGQREEVEVRFPVSLPVSSISRDMVESEQRLKLMIWNKERIDEDIKREKSVLDKVRSMYILKKEEFMKFLAQTAPLMSKHQDLLGKREMLGDNGG